MIQHDAADPPGAVGDIAESLGHRIETIRLDRGDTIPSRHEADALMSFGGGVLLSGDDIPSWIVSEENLMREFVDSNRKVLGICLGAQILAKSLGAPIIRNENAEVGWHRVIRLTGTDPHANGLPNEAVFFHWHRDTFSIPFGATRLFESLACKNQGFAFGSNVIGLQFHLEATERTVKTFLAVSSIWRQTGKFIQQEREIVEGVTKHLPAQRLALEAFLKNFIG